MEYVLYWEYGSGFVWEAFLIICCKSLFGKSDGALALSPYIFYHQTLNADDEGSMFGSLVDHPYMPVYTERLYVEAIKAGSDRISALHPHCARSTLTS